jgi:hypothetical protein
LKIEVTYRQLALLKFYTLNNDCFDRFGLLLRMHAKAAKNIHVSSS